MVIGYGKTMIFFKDYQYKEIEQIRDTIISKHLIIIQKMLENLFNIENLIKSKNKLLKYNQS